MKWSRPSSQPEIGCLAGGGGDLATGPRADAGRAGGVGSQAAAAGGDGGCVVLECGYETQAWGA